MVGVCFVGERLFVMVQSMAVTGAVEFIDWKRGSALLWMVMSPGLMRGKEGSKPPSSSLQHSGDGMNLA